ncbi:MAG: hypothetical protein IPI45_02130 [Saprospiraceae bacterium]|nr:hypothetical protein [Saprospiraceae bacterium]MBK7736552.1 hypothetical protein [Saprospiraceae bacterium]MBK7912084.1 hypothetical protein [Saprospiraceae bacterium]
MSSNIRLEKTCQYCGENFIAKPTVTALCSDNCANHSYENRKREEMVQLENQKENKRVLFNPINTSIIENFHFNRISTDSLVIIITFTK